MRLTPHFALEELTFSQNAMRLGIDNTPPPDVLTELQLTAEMGELGRAILGSKAWLVGSGYRSPALNAATPGSAKDSAHTWGGALDFIAPSVGTPLYICRELAKYAASLKFDKLIYEWGWVHIQRPRRGDTPRGELWTLVAGEDGPRYVRGFP